MKKLAKLGGKLPFSTASRTAVKRKPRKPIRKVNPKAKAKRIVRYRKMLSGKEYKAARSEALERAGDRCEWNATDGLQDTVGKWFGVGNKTDRDPFRNDPSRCEMTTELQAHHLRYPKSRPVAVTDLVILCNWHHRQAESLKLGKTRMF